MDHPERGEYKMPGWPVKVGDSHLPIPAAPLLGEHVDSVLMEWLNMSSEEVEKLRGAGAV